MAQISSNKCRICEENQGIFSCYDCQHLLCQLCHTYHNKFPATKRHTVTDSHHVDRTVLNLNVSCENHNQEFFYFCQNCKCLTCAVCVITDHMDHSFRGLQEISEEKRNVIKVNISNLQSKINLLSTSIDTVKTQICPEVEKNCNEFAQSVKSICTEFHNMIDFVAEISITDAKEFYILEKQQMEYNLAEMEKSLKEYISTGKKCEQTLAEKHNSTFICNEKTLLNEIDKLGPIPDIKLPIKKKFDTEEFTTAVIEQILSKYRIRIIEELKQKLKELETIKEVEKLETKKTIDEKDADVTQIKEFGVIENN